QVIPPAYGLQDVHSVTVTGDGTDLAYWNRYVAVTQMGGHGTFTEPRTGVAVTNPPDDLVSSKLAALPEYQLSIAAPRGKAVFEGPARCATCHSGSAYTGANTRLHAPTEVVSEPEPAGIPSYA